MRKVDKSLRINSYYGSKVIKLQNELKSKLSKIESDLESQREKLTKKYDRKIKACEIDKVRKLKNLEREKEGKTLLKEPVRRKKPVNHMSKADYYFSRVVRSIWAELIDWEWYNYDPTSSSKIPIKDLTCWHYKTRGIYTTRYLLANCIPQTHGQNKREHLDPRQKIIFRQCLINRDWLQSVNQLDLLESQWNKNENEKINMQEMHEYRKQQYQLYEYMRK